MSKSANKINENKLRAYLIATTGKDPKPFAEKLKGR